MPDLSNWGQHGTLRNDVPYGQDIDLRCKNHPHLRWFTKNIAPIGARTIFFSDWGKKRGCDCPASDLEVVQPEFVALANAHLRLDGETLGDFGAELKKLTPGDRLDLIKAFEAMGYTIQPL